MLENQPDRPALTKTDVTDEMIDAGQAAFHAVCLASNAGDADLDLFISSEKVRAIYVAMEAARPRLGASNGPG